MVGPINNENTPPLDSLKIPSSLNEQSSLSSSSSLSSLGRKVTDPNAPLLAGTSEKVSSTSTPILWSKGRAFTSSSAPRSPVISRVRLGPLGRRSQSEAIRCGIINQSPSPSPVTRRSAKTEYPRQLAKDMDVIIRNSEEESAMENFSSGNEELSNTPSSSSSTSISISPAFLRSRPLEGPSQETVVIKEKSKAEQVAEKNERNIRHANASLSRFLIEGKAELKGTANAEEYFRSELDNFAEGLNGLCSVEVVGKFIRDNTEKIPKDRLTAFVRAYVSSEINQLQILHNKSNRELFVAICKNLQLNDMMDTFVQPISTHSQQFIVPPIMEQVREKGVISLESLFEKIKKPKEKNEKNLASPKESFLNKKDALQKLSKKDKIFFHAAAKLLCANINEHFSKTLSASLQNSERTDIFFYCAARNGEVINHDVELLADLALSAENNNELNNIINVFDLMAEIFINENNAEGVNFLNAVVTKNDLFRLVDPETYPPNIKKIRVLADQGNNCANLRAMARRTINPDGIPCTFPIHKDANSISEEFDLSKDKDKPVPYEKLLIRFGKQTLNFLQQKHSLDKVPKNSELKDQFEKYKHKFEDPYERSLQMIPRGKEKIKLKSITKL